MVPNSHVISRVNTYVVSRWLVFDVAENFFVLQHLALCIALRYPATPLRLHAQNTMAPPTDPDIICSCFQTSTNTAAPRVLPFPPCRSPKALKVLRTAALSFHCQPKSAKSARMTKSHRAEINRSLITGSMWPHRCSRTHLGFYQIFQYKSNKDDLQVMLIYASFMPALCQLYPFCALHDKLWLHQRRSLNCPITHLYLPHAQKTRNPPPQTIRTHGSEVPNNNISPSSNSKNQKCQQALSNPNIASRHPRVGKLCRKILHRHNSGLNSADSPAWTPQQVRPNRMRGSVNEMFLKLSTRASPRVEAAGKIHRQRTRRPRK